MCAVMQATIFIESVSAAYHEPATDDNLASNMTFAHFEDLAVAINMVRSTELAPRLRLCH
jgi:hypothetical protein